MIIGIIAIAMTVGMLFIREAGKILTGVESPYALIALMFVWDGIIVFTMRPYATKHELAAGLMIGTLGKIWYLLKNRL